MRDVKNIISNAIRLGAGKELVRKAVGKCLEPRASKDDMEDWCRRHASSVDDWVSSEDCELWEQAVQFAVRMKEEGKAMLERLDVQLGGGGHYGLLYFLTKSRRPAVVVETGVAAGFSSRAILSAMSENDFGHLYSSDFPYCRLDEPEKYIGILVGQELRDRWTLHIRGDRANLPDITRGLSKCSVDFFHYDSDKSYSGRAFAYDTIKPYLAPGSACIFDDIQNNWHFKDLVDSGDFDWWVFEFGGKYLGLLQKAR